MAPVAEPCVNCEGDADSSYSCEPMFEPQKMLRQLKQLQAEMQRTVLHLEEVFRHSEAALREVSDKALGETVMAVIDTASGNGEAGDHPKSPVSSEELSVDALERQITVEPAGTKRPSLIVDKLVDELDHDHGKGAKNAKHLQKIIETQMPEKARTKSLPRIREGIWNWLKAVCNKIILDHRFESVISLAIVANIILFGVESQLALEGRSMPWTGPVEIFFLIFYSLECVVRFIAAGWFAFCDRWFLLDVVLVMSSLVEQMFVLVTGEAADSQQVMILRTMRLIRLVRTFRMLKKMRSIWGLVNGLLNCGETMASTFFLLAVVLYMFGVLGVELIAQDVGLQEDPTTKAILERNFSSLSVTMLSLTQFVTMDSIADMYLPLTVVKPWLALYFGLLISVVSISLMNLVTAVMVEGALDIASKDRLEEQKLEKLAVKQLLKDLLLIFDFVDSDDSGEISITEVKELDRNPLPVQIQSILDQACVDSMLELFDILDVNSSGKLSRLDFIEGLLEIFLREVPVWSLQMLKLLRRISRDVEGLKSTTKKRSAHSSTSAVGSARQQVVV